MTSAEDDLSAIRKLLEELVMQRRREYLGELRAKYAKALKKELWNGPTFTAAACRRSADRQAARGRSRRPSVSAVMGEDRPDPFYALRPGSFWEAWFR